MAATIFRAGMACVAMAVVGYLEDERAECRLEPCTNARNALLGHAGSATAERSVIALDGQPSLRFSSLRDCFAVLSEIHTACETATSSNKPVMPNSLKSTHVFSEK